MLTFDAAKRDVCAAKRERTASPLQALVLMNGPQFVEAARKLGERLLKAHGDDAPALANAAFQYAAARNPNERELAVLAQLYAEQLAHFEANPNAAAEFLKVGDAPADASLPPAKLAAAAVLAKAVLSMDECVMRR